MSEARRVVRATASFFEDLDRFPPSVVVRASPRRTTSRSSSSFGELIPGRADYRVLISAGMLVARFAVVGQLAPDGAMELVQLDIDVDADG